MSAVPGNGVIFQKCIMVSLSRWDGAALSALLRQLAQTLLHRVVITCTGARWALTGVSRPTWRSTAYHNVFQNMQNREYIFMHMCSPPPHTHRKRDFCQFCSHFHPIPSLRLGSVWMSELSLWSRKEAPPHRWASDCDASSLLNHKLTRAALYWLIVAVGIVPSAPFCILIDCMIIFSLLHLVLVTSRPPPHFSECLLLLFHFRIILCSPLSFYWSPLCTLDSLLWVSLKARSAFSSALLWVQVLCTGADVINRSCRNQQKINIDVDNSSIIKWEQQAWACCSFANVRFWVIANWII